jgi:hypothetical protein
LDGDARGEASLFMRSQSSAASTISSSSIFIGPKSLGLTGRDSDFSCCRMEVRGSSRGDGCELSREEESDISC